MDLGLAGKRALVTGNSAGAGAGVARMLASPAAGYMTGANIRVDGGQVQSIN